MGRWAEKGRRMGVAGLAIALLAWSGAALGERPPEVSHDGLHLQPDTKFALVYLRPGADFSQYSRIALLDCEVAFRKNWQRDQNSAQPLSVSKADMDKMRAQRAIERRIPAIRSRGR